MLNFNQLQAVTALHEHKNFHRAAESISITQPALTLRIQSVEELIGQTLFDRSQRSVRATDAGELVVSYAKEILGRFDDLENALSGFSDIEHGEVEFGVGPYIVKRGFAEVIRKFCGSYPSIKPRFRVAASDSLHAQLKADEISMYVAESSLGVEDESCTVEPLFVEEIVIVARPGHPLAQRKRVHAKDIVQYPMVGVTERVASDTESWFLARLNSDRERRLMAENQPYIVCDYYEATRVLVLSTDYLTWGPIELVRKDLDNGTLVKIGLPGFDPMLTTGIVTRQDRTLSPAAIALRGCFEQVYRDG